MSRVFLFSLLAFGIAVSIFAVASTALAGDPKEFLPIVPLPGISEQDGSYADDLTFAAYVNRIFDISISIGGILAVLMLVLGGFEYMTSEATGGKKNGLDRIRGALIGLLLLLMSVLILNVINPCLTQITVFTDTTSDDNGCSDRRTPVQEPANEPGSSNNTTQTPTLTPLPVGGALGGSTMRCEEGDPTPVCATQNGSQTAPREANASCVAPLEAKYLCASGEAPSGLPPGTTEVPMSQCNSNPQPTGVNAYCCTSDRSSCSPENPQTSGFSCPNGQTVVCGRTELE